MKWTTNCKQNGRSNFNACYLAEKYKCNKHFCHSFAILLPGSRNFFFGGGGGSGQYFELAWGTVLANQFLNRKREDAFFLK
jgi:hypothetical protein